jgi:adenylate cyclase
VPLLTPEPDAWILTGFPINQSFTEEIKGINLSEISVVHAKAGQPWHLDASTLPAAVAAQLPRLLDSNRLMHGRSLRLELNHTPYVSLLTPIIDENDTRIVAVLQRSLADQLRPFKRLEYTLFILFTLGLSVSIVGAALVSRGVTRPVLKLTRGARRIAEGDYLAKVEIPQQDEIGILADSFNHMARGLAEKEKVRTLLGKVVSPEIAEELLSKGIELGGEEREASILFSDVRNFTALCEGKSPSIILDLLNRYLTKISTVIEQNGGVVDKYIGDAVMALFGAPLQHDDDPDRAVQTALGMCEALEELNREFASQGLAEIGIGVGINTGLVVAGNMGSINRLNYTVIGDSVNLASRLEGLTKQYGVLVITSESTVSASRKFVYRELDCVRVKGKLQPVGIFEPLAHKDRILAETLQELDDYHTCLRLYRAREWNRAVAEFERLAAMRPACRLYHLYLERSKHFRKQPPDKDWDGTCTYTQK